MATAAAIRLPGVYFLPPPRAGGIGLPPLDAAAFVGFAERGPLHVPVRVDDPDSYRAIFGGDVAVAREESGTVVHAYLPPAVQAFFANGGRRCYIVRVADRAAAKPTTFRLEGLVSFGEGGQRTASIQASSPGRWGDRLRIRARLQSAILPADMFSREGPLRLSWDPRSAPSAITRGDLLRLTLADGSRRLFPVSRIQIPGAGSAESSPDGGAVSAARVGIVADSAWGVESPESLKSAGLPEGLASPPFRRVERLRFVLVLRIGEQKLPTLDDLAFNAGGARFWGDAALLKSSPLYQQSSADADYESVRRSADAFRALASEEHLDDPPDTITLAGLLAPLNEQESRRTFLPLGMPEVISDDDLIGPDTEDMGSDGLDSYSSRFFLDEFLVPFPANQRTSGGALLTEALDRLYIQDQRLRGIHSLFGVEEIALIATPDAVHPGWDPATRAAAEAPHEEEPPPPPPSDPWRFNECEPPAPAPPAGHGESRAAPPVDLRLPVLRPQPEPGESIPAELLQIQVGLTRLCEARRDVVGILSLPVSFEKRLCVAWLQQLRQKLDLPPRASVFNDVRDIADLSYVAVYHPWLRVFDSAAPDRLRGVPPDGAICGTIARRERERQAWIAPANLPIDGVLGLVPEIPREDAADLFDLQFNVIRSEPRDFRAISAHTLSDERSLLQISVRRLLILLRKVAVERGMDFVFDNNSEAFREGVRMSLDEMLRFMFRLGAFAGISESDAFRVVTDQSVNTPQSVDRGRFIAQIQVSPSQPMEFITVLLTRVGETLQATEA